MASLTDEQKEKMTLGTKRGWADPIRRIQLIESIRKHRRDKNNSSHVEKRILQIVKDNPRLGYKEIGVLLNCTKNRIRHRAIELEKRGMLIITKLSRTRVSVELGKNQLSESQDKTSLCQ